MLPADRTLQEMAAALRDAQRRIARLETLETPAFGGVSCLETKAPEDAASVTFSSINQNFLHLWLWILAQNPGDSSIGCPMLMTFNGDGGNNYNSYRKSHVRQAGPVDSESIVGGVSGTTAFTLGNSGGIPHWGVCEANIFNYALFDNIQTRRPIAWKAWYQFPDTGEISGAISAQHGGGEWTNTSDSITSITVSAGGGSCLFGEGSLLTLVGICPISA